MAQKVAKAIDFVVRNVDTDTQWSRAVSHLKKMSGLERSRAWIELSNRAMNPPGCDDDLKGIVLHSQYKFAFKRALNEADAGEEVIVPLQCEQGVSGRLVTADAESESLHEAILNLRQVSAQLTGFEEQLNEIKAVKFDKIFSAFANGRNRGSDKDLAPADESEAAGELDNSVSNNTSEKKKQTSTNYASIQDINELLVQTNNTALKGIEKMLEENCKKIGTIIDEKIEHETKDQDQFIAEQITKLSSIDDIKEILKKGLEYNNGITDLIHSEFEVWKRSMPQLLKTLTEKGGDDDTKSKIEVLTQHVESLTKIFDPPSAPIDDTLAVPGSKPMDYDLLAEADIFLKEIDDTYTQTKQRIKTIAEIFNTEVQIYRQRLDLASSKFNSTQMKLVTDDTLKKVNLEKSKIAALLKNTVTKLTELSTSVQNRRI